MVSRNFYGRDLHNLRNINHSPDPEIINNPTRRSQNAAEPSPKRASASEANTKAAPIGIPTPTLRVSPSVSLLTGEAMGLGRLASGPKSYPQEQSRHIGFARRSPHLGHFSPAMLPLLTSCEVIDGSEWRDRCPGQRFAAAGVKLTDAQSTELVSPLMLRSAFQHIYRSHRIPKWRWSQYDSFPPGIPTLGKPHQGYHPRFP